MRTPQGCCTQPRTAGEGPGRPGQRACLLRSCSVHLSRDVLLSHDPGNHGTRRTAILTPVPPLYGVERRGRRAPVRRGRCGGMLGRACPWSSPAASMAVPDRAYRRPPGWGRSRPYPTVNAGPGYRRSPHGVAAIPPRIASRRRHRVRTVLACRNAQTRAFERKQTFPARRPGMTARSLLMGLIDRRLSAVGCAKRYGPRSRSTADDVVRWCHVGAARSPGPPDPCHLFKYL